MNPRKFSRRPFNLIGDGQVRQISVKEYYDLGKNALSASNFLGTVEQGVGARSLAWNLWTFRDGLLGIMQEPCALPSASQRATKALIESLNVFIPAHIPEIFDMDDEKQIGSWQLHPVNSAMTTFETVLSNDMPEMSTYAVSQIGIFRTDDLISHAERQISPELLLIAREQANSDIRESGKCLAFRISTASAFHSCRAIETCMDQYIEDLTGSPYQVSTKGGNNNWGAKIEFITKNKGADKITEFLLHIKKQYRNPVTHPEETVGEHEAKDLFGASISAISMMLGAVKEMRESKKTASSLSLTPLLS